MTKKFSLKPFPVGLTITNSRKLFEAENTCDLIGFADHNGTQLLMAINPENDAMTQLDACVHESVHVCQYVEDIIETKFDKETEAYLVEHVAKLACGVCGLTVKKH